MTARACAWCRGPIPATSRRDAVCCSVRCRQARHRFAVGVGSPVAQASRSTPLRLAYADPPYPGKSRRYYGSHPDYAGEVDHAALIRRLVLEHDGWALSTSASALPAVLALCPDDVRVAAWVKGERPTRSAGPLNAWEPVIYRGGRLDPSSSPADATRLLEQLDDASGHTAAEPDASSCAAAHASRGSARRVDVLVAAARARTTDPGRVVGAKPAVFCRWVFDLLGAQPGDHFTDVFPGSGGVQRAWEVFTAGQPSQVATGDASRDAGTELVATPWS